MYYALLHHLNFNTHQMVDVDNEGETLISSRGPTFILNEGSLIVHKLGDQPSITVVASKLDPFLLTPNKPHWVVVMD